MSSSPLDCPGSGGGGGGGGGFTTPSSIATLSRSSRLSGLVDRMSGSFLFAEDLASVSLFRCMTSSRI